MEVWFGFWFEDGLDLTNFGSSRGCLNVFIHASMDCLKDRGTCSGSSGMTGGAILLAVR